MAKKLVVPVLIALLAGCGTAVPATRSPDALASTSWVLETLNGEPVDIAAGITLAFSAGGTLNGSDGCNDYTAGYTLTGANVSILAPVGTTQKGCSVEVLERSAAYLAALSQAASYLVEGEKLKLVSADGAVLASFQQLNP